MRLWLPSTARVATAFLASLLCVEAHAQSQPPNYPKEPVRLVVPYPPGGTVDILARALSDGMSPLLGQPVIVDNRPGAGGTIAGAFVAKAKPDGYTLFVSDVGPIAIGRSIYPNLTFDPVVDFAPVSIATVSILNLTINPNVPAKSVSEFIAMAKSNPGNVSFASSGVGTIMHMAGELFAIKAGVDLKHVPYRGGAPAVTAVLSGEVQGAFNQLSTTLPHIRDGRMRSLGVSSQTPAALAPDLPTIASQGVSGYEVLVWQGVLAPANTPKPIVEFLSKKVAEALQNPQIAKRLTDQGFDVKSNTPDEFAKIIMHDAEQWGQVAKARNIKPE